MERRDIMYEAFLKEYDLNEETMEKIMKECSKHCRSLRNFLMFSSWHSIPSYRLRTILDIYNKSSVNIKTGELIDISKDKSSKQLKNLSIRDIAKTIRIGSKAVFSDGKHIPYIFNIAAFDDEGKRLKNHNLLVPSSAEKDIFFLSPNKLYGYDQECGIRPENFSGDICEIVCEVFFDSKFETENIHDFSIEVRYEQEKEHHIDLTRALKKTGKAFAFRMVFDLNTWIVIPVNKSI